MASAPFAGRLAVVQIRQELPSTTGPSVDARLGIAIGLDVFFVVLFAALGRRSHEESGAFVDVFETAAPFLIGLAVGWLLVRAWRRPMSVMVAVAIWPITILVGMIARRTLFDRGTAPSFVVVATLFIGLFLVGWRLVARVVERRRHSAPG